MKLPIIILAVLGLVWGKPLQNGSLKQDVKEFMAHFPIEKVLDIALDYLANDEEVREYVAYVQSKEFPKIHQIVEQLQEYKDCFNYFNEQGVDVYAIVNKIHDTLGYPPFQPTNTTRTGVGLNGLIDDMIAALPLENLKPYIGNGMKIREYYKTLASALQYPVYKNMVDTVQAWPEYYELQKILQEMVQHVQRIIELGWEVTSRGTHSLQEDLKEFMALVPTHKVLEITLDYLANDPEFNEAYVYFQSEEFPRIHNVVEYLKQYKDCSKYINDQGVDIPAIVNKIHDTLGYPQIQPTNTNRTGVGFHGLINDVIAAFPIDDFKNFYHEKMETRQYFNTVVTALTSPALKNMVDTVRAWADYQKLKETLQQMGVDVDRITEYLREQYQQGNVFKNWNYQKLQEALQKMGVDVDRITEYLREQYQQGKETLQQMGFDVDRIIEYLLEQYQQGNVFKNWNYQKLHETLQQMGVDVDRLTEYIQEQYLQRNVLKNWIYQKLQETLKQMGVDVDRLTEYLREQYHQRNVFKNWNYQKLHKTLQEMGVDVDRITEYLREQYLQRNVLKNWIYQKLQETLQQMGIDVDRITENLREQYQQGNIFKNWNYQKFQETLQQMGVDVDRITEYLREQYHQRNVFKNWIYQKLQETLQQMGVDVDRITEYIREQYLQGTRRLQHELKEFMAHNLEIAMDYLANDEEVHGFVSYVQSEEFPKIHNIVQHLRKYKNCFNYFNEQGVDVYAIVNKIYESMGHPPFQPNNTTRNGTGFYGLIDDVYAAIPLDDLIPFLGIKMKIREFFNNLVTAINSPALKNMVNSVQSSPEFQELLEILQHMVADGERVIELVWQIILRETQSLQDELKDYMALVPTDKVLEITLDYLANDPNFNKAYANVQSEEFPRIHKTVEYLKQYQDCFNYFNEQGVDVQAIVNQIHDTLGYPPFQPTNTTRTGVGFCGFKDDVIAAFSFQDLKNFYYEKMETRQYFKALDRALKSLVAALKNPKFVNVVEKVQARPEYQKLLEALQPKVDRIIEYSREQFGFHCPDNRTAEHGN